MTKKKPKKSYANQRRSEAMKARWAARRASITPAVKVAIEKTKIAGHLSAEEIHDIIESCQSKGVLSFRYGPLQLLFKKTIDDQQNRNVQPAGGDTLDRVGGASKVDRGERLQEASDLATEELEHLKITDPAAYEEFIQSEEAEDGRS